MSTLAFLSPLQLKPLLLMVPLLNPQVKPSDLDPLAAQLEYSEYLGQNHNDRPLDETEQRLFRRAASYQVHPRKIFSSKMINPSGIAFFALAKMNQIIHSHGNNVESLRDLSKFADIIEGIPSKFFPKAEEIPAVIELIKKIQQNQISVFPDVRYKVKKPQPDAVLYEIFQEKGDIFEKYVGQDYSVAQEILDGLEYKEDGTNGPNAYSAGGEYGFYSQSYIESIFDYPFRKTNIASNHLLEILVMLGFIQKVMPNDAYFDYRFSYLGEYLRIDKGFSPFHSFVISDVSSRIMQQLSEYEKIVKNDFLYANFNDTNVIPRLIGESIDFTPWSIADYRIVTIEAALELLEKNGKICKWKYFFDANTVNYVYALSGHPDCPEKI